MTRRVTVLGAALLLASTVSIATACAPSSDSAGDAPATATPVATSPAPTPDVSESAAPVEEPKCDTIIPTTIVDDLESVGWTAQASPFRVGAREVEGGIQCIWGDFTVATDHVQIYGWAPMTGDEAADAQAELTASGWRLEETPEGTIVTESASTAITTDDDGYGLTYLFGDGWVKYADTKQGLLLIVWPAQS
ncbi:hypothetical protein [Microbacterium pygmaeum]|uniref:Uncharacterized protein n=1 Tax=Microbacterium pygmaeum TaxID=370764 RepID=A0A1G7ZT64_9MICO|nr:hypothetical protein [Microbacterium pygmaeum]SDH11885.1 hypothetical protein SAMN04489810_2159 [Microbacterium pygmaeum]